MCSCMTNFLVRASCAIQLWLICHPNFLSRFFLSIFYFFDLIIYGILGPKEFLVKRSELIGSNFASLGRIIVGEYEKCAEVIQSPQQRGYFLGRAELYPSRIVDDFLPFLSDREAGGGNMHTTLHEHLWTSVMPAAMERLSDPAFEAYLIDAISITETMNKEKAKISPVVQKMTIRYIFHAVFGAPIKDDNLLTAIQNLFFNNSPISGYVLNAVKPIGALFCCNSNIHGAVSDIKDYILQSPLMHNYEPLEVNGNKSKEEYAELLMAITAIAGVIGSANLCQNILTEVPDDCAIDVTSRKEVGLAVLEAARYRAPVNNVNVIIPKEKEVTVRGHPYTIPAGTVLAASIGLASHDASVFDQPTKFNHKRGNLLKATLNFNHLGFNAVGSGIRQCPGRNIAMKLAGDLLIMDRGSYSPPPETRACGYTHS